MYLQQKDSVYDLAWNKDVTYGQIYQRSEYEHSRYNFEESDAAMRFCDRGLLFGLTEAVWHHR